VRNCSRERIFGSIPRFLATKNPMEGIFKWFYQSLSDKFRLSKHGCPCDHPTLLYQP